VGLADSVVNRLNQLVVDAGRLSCGDDENDCAVDSDQVADCEAWLVSAQNAVQLCTPLGSAYRAKMDSLASGHHGWIVNQAVGKGRAVLRSLLQDAQAGLLVSVASHAQAEVFDDFLDDAEAYLERDRKNEAGAIAGVVFEDTTRRYARSLSLPEKDVKLDEVISSLASGGHVSAVQAKRMRVAAHVRTKATHAQWDEFEAGDVSATIHITRELVDRLAG